MDAKDLRKAATHNATLSDGDANYDQTAVTLQNNGIKTYQEIGSNSLGKVEVQVARPCAIIGPDRVVPPPTATDAYLKKASVEPWPCSDNVYRPQTDFSQKLPEYHSVRNISPRQTFQENMQRVMLPPSYHATKSFENNLKSSKGETPLDVKYCDVPYSMNATVNSQKHMRNSDIPITNPNPSFVRGIQAQGWPSGVNPRPQRAYAPDFYQYSDFPNYLAQRPMQRFHRPPHEDPAQVHAERIYHESNVRFKPYPNAKERYPQQRYDYIANFPNTYQQQPSFQPQKFDISKTLPSHPYPMYTQVPIRRIPEPVIDQYQRTNQPNFNHYPNQYIPPSYGPVPGNCLASKMYSYPTDISAKPLNPSKLPYDVNGKMLVDYDNIRNKMYPLDNVTYYNELNRKGDVALSTHPGMHRLSQPYAYRKENVSFEAFQHRVMDPLYVNNGLQRHPIPYSPALIKSPADYNVTNDIQTLGMSHEDCGYASQSSSTSGKSIDSSNYRFQTDIYKTHEGLYNSSTKNMQNKLSSKSSNKKSLDVRQFLQMWNEGEDEVGNASTVSNNLSTQSETISNPEQLVVLGLVNIPNEELSKYEHIQKISKLPENIKGYNSIELLNQYEQLVETPALRHVNKPILHEYQMSPKSKHSSILSRPISPLDVEAKISQSVIHKEVGCNFEIKPCSPKMLNVELATPLQNIIDERTIEKVRNKSINNTPHLVNTPENVMLESPSSSCKMNSPYISNNDVIKNSNYCLQDLESNSGVCLASLPRLDSDIELNFPEINQQFIDANKLKVHENIETIPYDTIPNCKSDKKNIPERILTPELPIIHKETSKLSKYRKNKVSEASSENNTYKTLNNRTDSVIIKNPDTARRNDENNSNVSTIAFSDEVLIESSVLKHQEESNNDTTDCNQSAIDFSLNKINSSMDNVTDPENLLFNSSYDSTKSNNEFQIGDEAIQSDALSLVTKKVEMELKEFENNEADSNRDIDIVVSDLSLGSVCTVPISPKQSEINISQPQGHATLEYTDNSLDESNAKANLEYDSNCLHGKDEESKLVNDMKKSIHNDRQFHKDIIENNIQENETRLNTSIPKESLDEFSNQNYSDLNNTKGSLSETDIDYNISQHNFNKECFINQSVITKYDNIEIQPKEETHQSIVNSDLITKDDKVDLEECLNGDSAINENPTNTLTPDNTKKFLAVQYPVSQDTSVVVEKLSTNVDVCKDVHENTENIICYGAESINETIVHKPESIGENPKNIFSDHAEIINKTETINCSQVIDMDLGRADCSTAVLGVIASTSTNSIDKNEDTNSFAENTDNSLDYEPNEILESHSSDLQVTETPQLDTHNSENNLLENCGDTSHRDNNGIHNTSTIDENQTLGNNLADPQIKVGGDLNITEPLNSPYECKGKEAKNPIPSLLKSHVGYCCVRNCFRKELFSPWIQKLLMFREGSDMDCFRQQKVLPNTTSNDIESYSAEEHLITSYAEQILEETVPNQKNIHDIINTVNEKDKVCIRKSDLNHLNQRLSLKRSLSDSALDLCTDNDCAKQISLNKRRKLLNKDFANSNVSEDVSNLIQNHRRNSISTIYSDESVYILLTGNEYVIEQEDYDSNKLCSTEDTVDVHKSSEIMNYEIVPSSPENTLSVDNAPGEIYIHSLDDKTIHETEWVETEEDMENIFNDDVAVDITISAPMSPENSNVSSNDIYSEEIVGSDSECEHIAKIKEIYGDNIDLTDIQLVETLYKMPQMEVNKTLVDIESHTTQEDNSISLLTNQLLQQESPRCSNNQGIQETFLRCDYEIQKSNTCDNEYTSSLNCYNESNNEEIFMNDEDIDVHDTAYRLTNNCSSLSSSDSKYSVSSSPEVSSTTSEEKNSSILLKITSVNGSRRSEIAETMEQTRFKFTERNDYSTNYRPLITKAAQKYIPPLIESQDLKVKLPLPQQSLHKLKQLKLDKKKSCVEEQKKTTVHHKSNFTKKVKPKFEDVLKSIDEIQIKMHREKAKKTKHSIPKVVIKKTENGAHYASTPVKKRTFNPDLTGRKWQPWVFIERNELVDRMAQKNKHKAVYCHRKKTFILQEKFKKYKSICTAKFVISQPSSDNTSSGNLKYTIRLKHNY
ncbi:unnamed protein product [Leptosia nina]|uniref:Uncharacterized protein n=1 Tax=Leptosia nina TaxID=320188 RepID=A0AAV1J7U3_9NEOP